MKNGNGEIIYVGKATSLRSRISQYFSRERDIKTSALVPHIASIEFVVTRDESEALILESNLIKANQPKFNLLLKDAKHYSYLAVTNEGFPRLLVARKNSKGKFRIGNAKFYGPYVEGAKRAVSASFLRKLFKIRTCGKMPKKPCLQYHLGNCNAPCVGKISAQDYAVNVLGVEQVLKGKGDGKLIVKRLEERMKDAAEAEDYELAKAIKEQMDSLGIFFGKQSVERKFGMDEDFIFLQRIGDKLHVRILRSEGGVIRKAERHEIEIRAQEEPEIAFCAQYYGDGTGIPERIYANLGDLEIEKLNNALGIDAFRVPRGDKLGVMGIAADSLQQAEIEPSVLKLQEALGIQKPPVIIETFDISTLFGENSVGSMVRFVNGKPDKPGYRKFKIRNVEGQDDFAMMKEIVLRRYSRLQAEMAQMPDLVLIDGGLGQLHAASGAIESLGLKLNIASIAKREEEIYILERKTPILLPRSDLGLRLVQHCRDEAHRFAIGFHRARRGKAMEGE